MALRNDQRMAGRHREAVTDHQRPGAVDKDSLWGQGAERAGGHGNPWQGVVSNTFCLAMRSYARLCR